jgi:hypothetical protein
MFSSKYRKRKEHGTKGRREEREESEQPSETLLKLHTHYGHQRNEIALCEITSLLLEVNGLLRERGV